MMYMNDYVKCHIFPFEKIEKDEEIIIWGNGVVGQQYMEQIRQTGYCKVKFVVDKKWSTQKAAFYNIKDPSNISKHLTCKIVVAQWDYKTFCEIQQSLLEMGISKENIIHSDYSINCESGVNQALVNNLKTQNKIWSNQEKKWEKIDKTLARIQKRMDLNLSGVETIKQSVSKVAYGEGTYTCGMPYFIQNNKRKFDEFKRLNTKFRNIDLRNVNDQTRVLFLMENVERTLLECDGDIAELGVYRGATAQILGYYCKKYTRDLVLLDTFDGFSESDLVGVDCKKKRLYGDNSLNSVKRLVGKDNWIHYKKGYFPDSVDYDVDSRKYAFVHIDCDLYQPISAGLNFFWDRMSSCGIIAIHDYASGLWEGATRAVDEFCATKKIAKIMIPDLSGTVVICKQ